ncbi:MAG: hypothetical protein Q9185_005722 [Variospora sp. 1 TL-2023]
MLCYRQQYSILFDLGASEEQTKLNHIYDEVIATSGPSSTFPQRAYRNPTDALVKFLDYKHGTDWAIWEFRAEGTGYPDSEVYGRIRHYPWPDHHPPPFALIPNIMASMRDWLKGPDSKVGRVVVVHCKAGKGRSGTAACSYLISEEGWVVEDALLRFTTRRMRSGFGAGVSIPSQLRWVRYVDTWTKHRKLYLDGRVEVVEVYVWGLRDGVKVAVEGYIDEGRTIKNFHTFHRHERTILETDEIDSTRMPGPNHEDSLPLPDTKAQAERVQRQDSSSNMEAGADAAIFRPSHPIILPTNDINIDFERRNKAAYGWTMVTSIAHVWFNAFFEGRGPEQNGIADPEGRFEIAWENMDGIKGSVRKGTKAFDRLAVTWRAVGDREKGGIKLPQIITEPKAGELVPETAAADWRTTENSNSTAMGKDLGLRTESPVSMGGSKASSLRSSRSSPLGKEEDHLVGVKTHGPDGEDFVELHAQGPPRGGERSDTVVPQPDLGLPKVASPEPTADIADPGGVSDGGMASISEKNEAKDG